MTYNVFSGTLNPTQSIRTTANVKNDSVTAASISLSTRHTRIYSPNGRFPIKTDLWWSCWNKVNIPAVHSVNCRM